MKIIINCRFLSQDLTGVQRFAEEITKRLVLLSSDVVLVAPPGKLRQESLSGLEIKRFGHLSGHGWEQLELPAFVRKERGFLINLANTAPVLLKRQLLVIHDLTWLKFPQSYSVPFRLVYRVLTSILIRRACAIATVSDYSRKEIAKVFQINSKKITVAGNAVDESFFLGTGFRPDSAPQGRFFLCVASVNHHKNIEGLVSAFRRYASQVEDPIPLCIVGGKSRAFSSVSSQLLEDCEDSGSIKLMGRVTDDELIWLYKNAVAFFFPSLYEGFGLPPLEALAAGCPVFSSHAASLPEVLGSAVEYFDPNSIEEMAQAFLQASLLEDLEDNASAQSGFPERYKDWSVSAKAIVEHISNGDAR